MKTRQQLFRAATALITAGALMGAAQSVRADDPRGDRGDGSGNPGFTVVTNVPVGDLPGGPEVPPQQALPTAIPTVSTSTPTATPTRTSTPVPTATVTPSPQATTTAVPPTPTAQPASPTTAATLAATPVGPRVGNSQAGDSGHASPAGNLGALLGSAGLATIATGAAILLRNGRRRRI